MVLIFFFKGGRVVGLVIAAGKHSTGLHVK